MLPPFQNYIEIALDKLSEMPLPIIRLWKTLVKQLLFNGSFVAVENNEIKIEVWA